MSKFKAGDRVILSPEGFWSRPETIDAAKKGTVGEVVKAEGNRVDIDFNGLVTHSIDSTAVLPAPVTSRDTRAETIAYLQGQLEKANKDYDRATDAVNEADRARNAADKRVTDLKEQIKLLTPPSAPKVGDLVKIKATYSTFYGQKGRVIEAHSSESEILVGGLTRTDGTKASNLHFRARELEVIA